MNMKLISIVIAISVAAGLSGSALASGVDTAARDRLSSMANATDPSLYYSSSSAHIGLGSFSYRVQNPRMSNLFSFSPPSINSSCNGWDIFAGSFAILSADRIMQTLRSLASAIPMVAFRMAMAWLSQQLESIVSDNLRELMKFNQEFQSGCELQETMLAGFEPTKDMGLDQLFGEMGNRLGSGMQSLGNQFKGLLSRTEDRAETKIDPAKVNRGLLQAYANSDDAFIHRNWIWEVMKAANLQYGGNSGTPYDLATDLISLTGTAQQCWVIEGRGDCLSRQDYDSLDNDQRGNSKVEYRAVLPSITFRDFVIGQTKMDGQQERKLQALVCEDGNEDPPCLVMTTVDRSTPMKGMQQIVHDIFLGPNNQPSQGIIGRAAQNATPSPFELRMLSASGQYGRMLMEIRKMHGEQIARNMAAANTLGLANEIAFGLMMDLLRELETNMAALDQGAPVESLSAARAIVGQAIVNAQKEYNEIAEQEETKKAMEDMRSYLRNAKPLTQG